MKKILTILLCIVILLGVSGCEDNKDNNKFKEEYESYNGKENNSGVAYRNVSIDEDNPFIYISAEEAVKKIEKKETFYLYVGDKQCPWCRSSIETAIKVAKQNKIEKIYYIYIWNDNHEEILRDKYVLEDEQPKLEIKGTDAYYQLLKHFDAVLADYNLTKENKEVVSVAEKRIFAPNYFYVKDGKIERFVTDTSKLQETPNAELTDEILKDQENQFNELFKG